MIAIWPLSGFSKKCVDEKMSVKRFQSRNGHSIVRGILQVSVKMRNVQNEIYNERQSLKKIRSCQVLLIHNFKNNIKHCVD